MSDGTDSSAASPASSGSPGKKSGRLKKWLLRGALAGAIAGVAMQLIPVEGIGENPTEDRYTLNAPPEVMAILAESCLDCHSNETRWPWYARIAPGSWLMARDVKKGRNHMNLSEWGSYDAEEREADKETAWEQIEEGEMPPWFYVYPMHLGASLDENKKALLKAWLLAPEQDDSEDEGEDDEETSPAGDTDASPGAAPTDAGTP